MVSIHPSVHSSFKYKFMVFSLLFIGGRDVRWFNFSCLFHLFSQTSSWRDHCFKMWGCRKNEKTRMQFPIILTNTTDSSYLGRIQVKQCWKPNFTAIKLTPLSEVGVFYFFVTFVVPIVIGPLILPLWTL